MCKHATLLFILVVALSRASAAGAYTLTFDEVPAGTDPLYYCTMDTPFCANYPFAIDDHSAASWGPPHSTTNVLVCNGTVGEVVLQAPPFGTTGLGTPMCASFFGAYFSTPCKNEVTMTLYKRVGNGVSPITSLTIGSRTEVWSDHFVGYDSPAGDIYYIKFQVTWLDPFRDPRTIAIFSLDNVTITPIPEPSSLATLACGLAGVGGALIRRRQLCR